MKRRRFGGDANATFGKARFLLAEAREEVTKLKGDDESPKARAKLRQAAEKGWFAMTAAADAYLSKRGRPIATSTREVFSAYGEGGSKVARTELSHTYSHLHIACGYNDDKSACRIPSVKASFSKAGRMIHELSVNGGRRRRRGSK